MTKQIWLAVWKEFKNWYKKAGKKGKALTWTMQRHKIEKLVAELAGKALVKRGPGRPRKIVAPPSVNEITKRKPGRPRKAALNQTDYTAPVVHAPDIKPANPGLTPMVPPAQVG